ncbi:MAG TPA: carbon monoxide dehydrogenase subunit G [Pyrinomonadaceae bacterium]|jgi:carbon monoxide dehydrogenase subunit G|nr:carbon monoxide dehydrogenase subunit G [Pyrinomonadaceae bacterium]
MKIHGTHRIQAPRDRVFSALIDPQVLQHCIPGCESLEKTGDNAYVATMKAGIGPVKGTFKGHVSLEDVQPPMRYRMIVDGKGGPGFVKGTGDFSLTETGAMTDIAYSGEMQVGGVIASVGQRMVEAAAKMLAGKFFSELEKEIGFNTPS